MSSEGPESLGGRQTFLEYEAVRLGTRANYKRMMDRFGKFAGVSRYEMRDQTLEIFATEFLEHIHLEGEGYATATSFKAALEDVLPRISKRGEGRIPRFYRALRGFKRLSPASSRKPHDVGVILLMTSMLMRRGFTGGGMVCSAGACFHAETKRGLEAARMRPDPSNKGRPELGHHGRTGGFGGDLESGHVRRVRRQATLSEKLNVRLRTRSVCKCVCKCDLLYERLAQLLGQAAKKHWREGLQFVLPETFNGKLRKSVRPPIGGSAKEMPMEVFQFGGEVRKRPANLEDVLVAHAPGAKISKNNKAKLVGPTQQCGQEYIVLDVYGGTGGVAAALSVKHGQRTVLCDKEFGPDHDVLDNKAFGCLKRKILRDEIVGSMIAPVCTICSRARWPPLRSTEEPMGLPNVGRKGRRQLAEANAVYEPTFQMIECLLDKSRPVIIQNPQSSIFWNLPRWQSLRRFHFDDHVVGFCQCNRTYKKPTTFRCCNIHSRHLGWKRRCHGCEGKGRAYCSRTGLKHVHLRGAHPTLKTYWTAVAQPYPEEVTWHLATILVNAIYDNVRGSKATKPEALD